MEIRRMKRPGCFIKRNDAQRKKKNYDVDNDYFQDSNLIQINLKKINDSIRETASFHFIGQIICPTLLTKTSGLSVFEINLNIENANLISLGRDRCANSSNNLTNNYIYGVKMLIRICKIEDDFYTLDDHPENVSINVNEISVNVMKNSLIDVTPYLKINPTIKNMIKIFNVQKESTSFYLVTAFLARRAAVKTIIERLLEKHIRSGEYTKKKIEDILRREMNELEFVSLEISLKCPLSRTIMTYPCQSVQCSHLACFETENYLRLNMDTEKWLCPVCKIYAPPENLVIDGYLLQILKTISEGCSSLILNIDGTCTPGK